MEPAQRRAEDAHEFCEEVRVETRGREEDAEAPGPVDPPVEDAAHLKAAVAPVVLRHSMTNPPT